MTRRRGPRGRRPRRLSPLSALVVALIAAVALGGMRSARAQEKSSKEYKEAIGREEGVLGKLRREIEANERKRQEFAKQEKNVLAEIHNLEKKIDLTDRLVTGLERDVDLRRKELEELDRRISGVGGDLAATRDALYRRLRAFYERRNVHPLEALFGSATFSDALRRGRYISLVAREDRRRVEAFHGLAETLSGQRQERREKLDEIQARRDEAEHERASLRKAEEEKETLHASVRRQKTQREKAIARLREATKRLEGLIDSLEKKRDLAAERERKGLYDLDQATGMLRWPVKGEGTPPVGRSVHPAPGPLSQSVGVHICPLQG